MYPGLGQGQTVHVPFTLHSFGYSGMGSHALLINKLMIVEPVDKRGWLHPVDLIYAALMYLITEEL